jgi:hypothetical protein
MRRAFSRLPKRARFYIFRNLISFNIPPASELTFKLAESTQELEEAFRILHEAYVSSGFMKRQESGMRVTVYHALPTTSTLIAKLGDKVVGTVSLIRDSALELPLQKIFDTSKLKHNHGQIVEISSLAIHPDHRGQQGEILFPLCKFLYEYCIGYFSIDHLVIAVNPRHTDLYEGLMLFEKLQEKVVEKYEFVDGAPAVGLFLDLHEGYNRILKTYWNQKPKRNLFTYFMQIESFKNFKFPNRTFFKSSDPVMSPDMLNYFFNEKTSVFKNLSDKEKNILHGIYSTYPRYLKVLPEISENLLFMKHKRRSTRFRVLCEGSFLIQGQKNIFQIAVVEISDKGFSAQTEAVVDAGKMITARIKISEFDFAEVQARAVWNQSGNAVGFTIIFEDINWKRFVGHLKNDLLCSGTENVATFAWPRWRERRIKKT